VTCHHRTQPVRSRFTHHHADGVETPRAGGAPGHATSEQGRCDIPVSIHPIRTGWVRIKRAQRERKPGGFLRVLTDATWTDWLPIYAWVIDHPEGIIVVDTGETSRTAEPGYFPRWHPYYRGSVRMRVEPGEEIGPQLEARGIRSTDVRTVVLTHFHTDHTGGLRHFPSSRILVPGADLSTAGGFAGRLLGYLPQHWPAWFEPTPIAFSSTRVGPFERSHRVTPGGDVVIVPTPGHTPGHVSVVVDVEDVSHFLAGDTSYTESLLRAQRPDGVSPRVSVTLETMARIAALASSRPTVYLPSHDPESAERLEGRQVYTPTSGQAARTW